MKVLGNLDGLSQQEDGTYAVTYENLTLTYRFTNPYKLELLAGDIVAHGSWYDLCEDDLKYFGSLVNEEQLTKMILRDIIIQRYKKFFKNQPPEAGDNIIILKPNGYIEVKNNPDIGAVRLKTMCNFTDCYFPVSQSVTIKNFPVEDVELVYNEKFLEYNMPDINKDASSLYGYEVHGKCICGIALLEKFEVDLRGSIISYGLTNEETFKILHYLSGQMNIVNTNYELN